MGEADSAYKLLEETGVNLFLTGKAGTGKTTFLRNFSKTTDKRHVVLAPTGVAAINAGGQTIHSFFQFPLSPFVPGVGFYGESNKYKFNQKKLKLIKSLDLIIIDEISMVRPDIMDAIDNIMRRYRNPLKPFGGVQLLLIGDLRQLAPVAVEKEWDLLKKHYRSPYFFESLALKEAGFLMIELTHVYRQNDMAFLDILNKIRDNKADFSTLVELNKRADRALFPENPDEEGYIRLTSHNYMADSVNSAHIRMLDAKSFKYKAVVKGKFPETSYPAEEELELKVGARVMFIKNHPNHEYYNGLIGDVVDLFENEIYVKPQKKGAEVVRVERAVWENISYAMKEDGEIKEVVEGSFEQYPLRLAWAITIHKSQGLTFEKAIVDAASSFAPGQTYVALSRCCTLSGLLLESPLHPSSIMIDPAVNHFIETQPRLSGDMEEIENFKESYYAGMLHELFDFRNLDNCFDSYFRASSSAFPSIFPKFMDKVYDCKNILNHEIIDVASKLYSFFATYVRHRKEDGIAEKVNAKISGGAAYFYEKISVIKEIVYSTPLSIDNKAVKKHLVNSLEPLMTEIEVKLATLNVFKDAEFDSGLYLKAKTGAIVKMTKSQASMISGKRRENPSGAGDIRYPKLYARLAEWRLGKAAGKPAFTVLNNRTLVDISNFLPENSEDLLMINGISSKRIKEFGNEIINIVADFKKTL